MLSVLSHFSALKIKIKTNCNVATAKIMCFLAQLVSMTVSLSSNLWLALHEVDATLVRILLSNVNSMFLRRRLVLPSSISFGLLLQLVMVSIGAY